jgi:hypothetical protein
MVCLRDISANTLHNGDDLIIIIIIIIIIIKRTLIMETERSSVRVFPNQLFKENF